MEFSRQEYYFSSVQSLSRVLLFVTPWTAARQYISSNIYWSKCFWLERKTETQFKLNQKKGGRELFIVSCNWESQNSTNRMSSENSFVSVRGSPSGEQMFTSCFIDYAKAFDCVDHNKLWKILKEMGVPDHLTCLLRNLYAS